MIWRSIGWSTLLWLLVGCASNNGIVSNGPFQKRKYQPGWHVDLGSKKRIDRTPTTTERTTEAERMNARSPFREDRLSEQPLEASNSIGAVGSKNGIRVQSPQVPSPKIGMTLPDVTEDQVASMQSRTGSDGPRYWNRMALISGIFLVLSLAVIAITGGGGILAYLLSFAFITGVIGLLLAIKHKEKGIGIAIAAIAFPIAILVAVIASLNAVW